MAARRWRTWKPGERNNRRTEGNTTNPTDTLAFNTEPQNVGLVVQQATDNDAIQIKTGRKWYRRLWYLLSNWWNYLFKGERRW